MLDREKALGIMIDMQEKLVPAIAHNEQLTANIGLLLRGLRILGIDFITTQQYTKGLGMTVPELAELTDGSCIEKITFSCMREPAFAEEIKRSGAKQFIVCGTETHICVEQTVLGMLDAGLEVYLIADCVGSRFDSDKEIALRRMEKAGAILTTAEAALFELTERAGTDEFRSISRLVKDRRC